MGELHCEPPPLLPGFLAWGETVRALREQLIPLGWERSDKGNLSLVLNQTGNLAIAVSTGDERTGNIDEEPCTKSSKGPRTVDAVSMNQLLLFPEIPGFPVSFEGMDQRSTWWLLIHRDVKASEVRCELSSPINMSADGRIDGWAERIILEPIPFDGDFADISEDIILRLRKLWLRSEGGYEFRGHV